MDASSAKTDGGNINIFSAGNIAIAKNATISANGNANGGFVSILGEGNTSSLDDAGTISATGTQKGAGGRVNLSAGSDANATIEKSAIVDVTGGNTTIGPVGFPEIGQITVSGNNVEVAGKLTADGTAKGNGSSIAVFASDNLDVAASANINARSGTSSGNGGDIQLVSQNPIHVDSKSEISAKARNKKGTDGTVSEPNLSLGTTPPGI